MRALGTSRGTGRHIGPVPTPQIQGRTAGGPRRGTGEQGRPSGARAVAVDTGTAVNPLTLESQFQAVVTFGVSQLMAKGAITFKDGRVEQRNFDAYTPPYIVDAPVNVDVHIVANSEAPSGCGEPPVPVISPAVVNALAKLSGKRYRTLPLMVVC